MFSAMGWGSAAMNRQNGSAHAQPRSAPATARARPRVVLLVCDGLRPDRIDPARMPALTHLRRTGMNFPLARTVFPSETRVAAASLVTGCLPGDHGLLANDFYDPRIFAARPVATASGSDLVELARIRGRLLARQTLAERLAANGLRYAVVSTASEGTSRILAEGATIPLGFVWSPHPGIATPGAAAAVAEAVGAAPAHAIPRVAAIDHAARVLTEYVLPNIDPDVAILWSGEPDSTYHRCGLGGAEAAIAERAADDALAHLLAWRAINGEDDRMQVVVASDHGHLTGSERIDVARLIRAGGWPVAEGTPGALDIVVVPGSATFVYGLQDGTRRSHEFIAWLSDQDWCDAVFARRSIAGRAGLADLGLDHPAAPDLVFTLRQDDGMVDGGIAGRCLFDAELASGAGIHGGLHRHEMASTLAVQGSMFRSGATGILHAGLVDIAPTILDVLGVSATGMRGRCLVEAYADSGPVVPAPTRHEILLPEASRHSTALKRSQVGETPYLDGLTGP